MTQQITRGALADAINPFLDWFEDNFGEEQWFDTEDPTDSPDGTWKSYLELPQYQEAIRVLTLVAQQRVDK